MTPFRKLYLNFYLLVYALYAYFNKGIALIELKFLDQALECFSKAIKINNESLDKLKR